MACIRATHSGYCSSITGCKAIPSIGTGDSVLVSVVFDVTAVSMGEEILCFIEAEPLELLCWCCNPTGVFGNELPRVCVCVTFFVSRAGFSVLTLSLLLDL